MSENPSVAIVSAADDGYLDLVRGLIHSVREAQARVNSASPLPVHVIDLGLSDASREVIAAQGGVVRACEVEPPIERSDMSRPHQLSRWVKALLPELAPGFDIYIWLDADLWVQHAWMLDMLIRAAEPGYIGIVPELDRAYASSFIGLKMGGFRNWYYPRLLNSFGEEVARDLVYRPSFNAGALSARADSPLWAAWRDRLQASFRSSIEVCDQVALNVAIYHDRMPAYPLPAVVNWICPQRLPGLNTKTMRLTEPVLPCLELGGVHLTRSMAVKAHTLPTLDGGRVSTPLDYFSIRDLAGRK